MASSYYYECTDCGKQYPGEGVVYLCPACSAGNRPGVPPRGVLKTRYPYEEIKKGKGGRTLYDHLASERFLELMPLSSWESWTPLRIGTTPFYKFHLSISQLPGKEGNSTGSFSGKGFSCFLKDDSQNPTFSFKDRASALVSAWAAEHGINKLVAASTGNAGSSLAGICTSVGQQAVIVVPASAPVAKLTQVIMYGARLVPVKGTYDDAFALSIRLSEHFGWYNRNTAFNPLTIEGKKSVAFELFRDMNYQVPDRIFIPVGDGVIYSGVCKGFEDMLELGIIEKMPVLVAVQSAGSPNLANNLERDDFLSIPSKTLADSISVDAPGNFYMTRDYHQKYHGEWVVVTDDEIMEASAKLARNTGIFAEPAAAAAFAGILSYHRQERLSGNERNVVLLTGSGLKDAAAAGKRLMMPDPVEPDIREVMKLPGFLS